MTYNSQVKATDLPWLPTMPDNWGLVKLKSVSQVAISTVDRHVLDDENSILVCHYPLAYRNEVISKESKLENGSCSDAELENFALRARQIIITKDSESADDIGVAAFIEEDIPGAVCGYHLALLTPDSDKINAKYLFWYLRSNSARQYFATNANGVTRFGLSKTVLENMLIPFPSLNEQARIVAFVDNATSSVDEVVRRKREIIELLKLKKVAIIGEAITRGIDGDRKLKESGHAWLGKIPETWGVRKNKVLFLIKKEIAGELGYDVLSVTQRGIKVKDISTNKGQISFDYSKYQLVDPGDFVMNHMDLLTGFIDISKKSGVTSPDYRVFKLVSRSAYAPFYLYVFQFCYLNKTFYGLGQGVSQLGRWRMPAQEFYDFAVPFPGKDEQIRIVEYLDERINLIESIIARQQLGIAKLVEFRQAVICEKTTGHYRK